jgi:RNA polymerase primary sigma factor
MQQKRRADDTSAEEWRADVRALDLPLLSSSEECTLGHRIAHGEQDALDELIVHNLRLVPGIAAGYLRMGVLLADLIQEGNIGLMRAARRYDPGRGFRFSTYATWWIRQACERACTESARLIHVPTYLLTREHAERLTVLPTTWPLISLDMPATRGGRESGSPHQMPTTLGETIPDDGPSTEDQAEAHIAREEAKEVLAGLFDAAHLDARERRILLSRSAGTTLNTISQQLGCTRERVRQLETRAMRQMRAAARVAGRRSYVSATACPADS